MQPDLAAQTQPEVLAPKPGSGFGAGSSPVPAARVGVLGAVHPEAVTEASPELASLLSAPLHPKHSRDVCLLQDIFKHVLKG